MSAILVASVHPDEALAALLGRVAQKDREAFRALYRATSGRLYGVVATLLGRGPEAEDVVQDVYVRIWERAGDFDPRRGAPIGWLVTIARHRAIDELRRKPRLSPLTEENEPVAAIPDPLAEKERGESLRALVFCLSALDPERREAIMLAYYRGASREFIAARLGRPVPTIKTWLRRSLAQLRTCLDR